MKAELPNFDGRIEASATGESDVYIPGYFWPKLVYTICSLLVVALGVWLIWDPAARFLAGQSDYGRVAYVIQTQPGLPDKTIHFATDIPEKPYTVVFQHYVAIEDASGKETIKRLGVDSAKKPYAKVNDVIEVIHFDDDPFAFALYHHRTWAFGCAFLSVGLILSLLSINTLLVANKPIPIDPESEEDLAAEQDSLQRDAKAEAK